MKAAVRYAIITIAATLALVAAFLVGVWISDNANPVETHSNIMHGELWPGGTAKLTTDFTRRANCGYHADRFILDYEGTRFTLPDLDYRASPAPTGRQTVTVLLELDSRMAPGPATYVSIPSHWCNPIQRLFPVTDDRIIVPFTVESRRG